MAYTCILKAWEVTAGGFTTSSRPVRALCSEPCLKNKPKQKLRARKITVADTIISIYCFNTLAASVYWCSQENNKCKTNLKLGSEDGKKGGRFYSEPFNPMGSRPGMGVHTFNSSLMPNRRQKRAELCEANSRTARATHPWKKPGVDTAPSTGLYVQTGMHLPHKFGGWRRI